MPHAQAFVTGYGYARPDCALALFGIYPVTNALRIVIIPTSTKKRAPFFQILFLQIIHYPFSVTSSSVNYFSANLTMAAFTAILPLASGNAG